MNAIGGIGDWFLSNGELCAVITDKEHAAYSADFGGSLVDLWHCNSADDMWVAMYDQYNNVGKNPYPVDNILAESSQNSAKIIVVTEVNGLLIKTSYIMSSESPNVLNVEKLIQRIGNGPDLNMFSFYFSNPGPTLFPYTLNIGAGSKSVGFEHPHVRRKKTYLDVLDGLSTGDIQVFVGLNKHGHEISYGINLKNISLNNSSGKETVLDSFLITENHSTLFGFFTEDFYLLDDMPKFANYIQSRFMDLGINESIKVLMDVIVGNKADVSSVMENIYQGEWISGSLDTNTATIEVLTNTGHTINFCRVNQSGFFRFKLPADIAGFKLKVLTPSGVKIVDYDKIVNDLGQIKAGNLGTVVLPENRIMSLVFIGENKTLTPKFNPLLASISIGKYKIRSGDETNRISLAGIKQDISKIELPEGKYKVLATRGIEYTVEELHLVVISGETVTLNIDKLKKAVITDGLVSADFHVHSGVSMDSSLFPESRIIDFVSQGADVLVSTEHNVSFDMSSKIAELGLDDLVIGIPGVELTGMKNSEVTPRTIGHSNVFPIIAKSSEFLGGTIPFDGERLGSVIGKYKDMYPDSVFQLNHPRGGNAKKNKGFFYHKSIDVEYRSDQNIESDSNKSLLESHPGSLYRDIDFDAIELLNGKEFDQYKLVREDWFSLLKQGFYKVATANSDSHSLSQLVALPRNYVQVNKNTLSEVNSTDIVKALRKGNLFGTTGPIIKVTLGNVAQGGVFLGGRGLLVVEADSAPWIDINELRIFINGENTHIKNIERGGTIELELQFTEDSFVTVEVSGKVTDIYKVLAPGLSPLAFSNPIFVDVEGDGHKWN